MGLLDADLGEERSRAALESMNGAASVTERADGYVQDEASQWVVGAVGAVEGDVVLDLCAAPGGKATALASAATVVAADVRPSRARLITANAATLEIGSDRLQTVVADGTAPPFAPGSFDRVLVDAPCSGLGSLRRRADARWRIDEAAPARLADVQRRLLEAAAPLVRPGGTLVYSVCTLTAVETTGVAESFSAANTQWDALDVPGEPWVPWGTGALLLPDVAGTDGMALFRWRAPARS